MKYLCREEFSLEMAAFQIIRGGFTSLDLASVNTCDGSTFFMTLLASWGIVADVDIESENMRKLGDARFFLGQCSVCVCVCMIMEGGKWGRGKKGGRREVGGGGKKVGYMCIYSIWDYMWSVILIE